jgi:uncharacterized membrane protein
VSADASAPPSSPSSAASRVNLSWSERWVSAAAGSGFVALGLTRRRAIPGAALTMIGAGLLWRGISGRSDLYGILGIDHAAKRAALAEEKGRESTTASGS